MENRKHPMLKLRTLELNGFRSFASAESSSESNVVEFGDTTILLGANGAGKSNVVQALELLSRGVSDSLDGYFRQHDPQSFFHMGPKRTSSFRLALKFLDEGGSAYLFGADFLYGHGNQGHGKVLVFKEEKRYDKGASPFRPPRDVKSGTLVPEGFWLNEDKARPATTGGVSSSIEQALYSILTSVRTYQFHDTSGLSALRLAASGDNARRLMSDGGNLPAFLLAMSQSPDGERNFRLIERHVQRVLPEFGGFDLALDKASGRVALNWKSRSNPEYVYGPHQLSDGSLRFIALATLLLQPAKTAPRIIVIDEPELGLHPVALSELAGMVKKAARHSQVILSTQSPQLIDEFPAKEIRVVEMDPDSGSSRVRALSEEKLAEWLKEYSPSELWEKNLIGGRP